MLIQLNCNEGLDVWSLGVGGRGSLLESQVYSLGCRLQGQEIGVSGARNNWCLVAKAYCSFLFWDVFVLFLAKFMFERKTGAQAKTSQIDGKKFPVGAGGRASRKRRAVRLSTSGSLTLTVAGTAIG